MIAGIEAHLRRHSLRWILTLLLTSVVGPVLTGVAIEIGQEATAAWWAHFAAGVATKCP